MKKLVVNCPQCDQPVDWNSDSRFRPFCSERCKLNDLGKWATESYRLPEAKQNSKEEE
jgi:endogenous inhibitor of DNA gyrase (YacG/DUF329 family)